MTALPIKQVQYRRERYACHLRVRSERAKQRGLAHTMTRWLCRCVRDEPIVMGRARVEVHRDFMTGQWLLRAEAYVYQDVQPEHADALRSLVDNERGSAVILTSTAT